MPGKDSTIAVTTKRALLVVAAAALLAAVPDAPAQGLRTLTGTVMDRTHEPLRGAVVEIVNEKTNSVESYLTDKTGQYNFKRLDPGTDYHFFATYRGHRSKQKRLGMFDSRAAETVNLTIKIE